MFEKVRGLLEDSAEPLLPALKRLRGLIYYHAGMDQVTDTLVNVSIWSDMEAAKQMDTLAPMLALRPVMEAVGVRFDQIANYKALWRTGSIGFV